MKHLFDKPLCDIVLKGIEPFEIVRVDGAKPKQCVPRPLSKKDTDFVTKKVTELLNAGVIVESKSPWRHNVVVVDKKDGSSRMTIKYKPVNLNTMFDAFPFPVIL